MVDDKEVKKPAEPSKETTQPSELSDADLEEIAGACCLPSQPCSHESSLKQD